MIEAAASKRDRNVATQLNLISMKEKKRGGVCEQCRGGNGIDSFRIAVRLQGAEVKDNLESSTSVDGRS